MIIFSDEDTGIQDGEAKAGESGSGRMWKSLIPRSTH